jgi:hypothetical protein
MGSVDGSRVAKAKCDVLAVVRVQTSVGPVDAVGSRLLALMVSASWVPALLIGLWRLGHSLGCPNSRSDRFAIISLCSHNS